MGYLRSPGCIRDINAFYNMVNPQDYKPCSDYNAECLYINKARDIYDLAVEF